MKGLSDLLGLKREAALFDSKLYIVKAMAAIATGYVIGTGLPLTRLDMISVLLGVMYNLEPINILGIKGGISQLIASTLGAACTSILIVFFGINAFVIAVSMALTLFVSLKINWRMVSPVAIFTCIYMTQYVQKDALGNPSIWLTYRLRIAALGLGVLIAILYNFIFSFLYYRRIAYKRLQFSKNQLLNGLEYTQKQLEGKCDNENREYITLFPAIFNDLDLVYSNISIMINEASYSFNLLHPEKLKTIERILKYFRDINHLAYDINFVVCRGYKDSEFDNKGIDVLEQCIQILKKVDFTAKGHNVELNYKKNTADQNESRINSNINSISAYIELALQEGKKL
ncbi:hypothetical protein JK636_16210 [Clostridium sp. YIM B02515]|uniref:FUSC family protein n=1 Tax=Clostridium rhizosphaerae TaxID=2803861 RepID=A0ABS1TD51_9CLOT|nr:hypothetical protein [Clostridium rhizosphaerae]MBL4937273.1 hypothetical protein [Clostridium rhizosphaerae]